MAENYLITYTMNVLKIDDFSTPEVCKITGTSKPKIVTWANRGMISYEKDHTYGGKKPRYKFSFLTLIEIMVYRVMGEGFGFSYEDIQHKILNRYFQKNNDNWLFSKELPLITIHLEGIKNFSEPGFKIDPRYGKGDFRGFHRWVFTPIPSKLNKNIDLKAHKEMALELITQNYFSTALNLGLIRDELILKVKKLREIK